MNELIFFVLLFLLAGIFYLEVFSKERRYYRKLVPYPEDLLKMDANLAVIDNPNEGSQHVDVFGVKFSSRAVLREVFKDINHLKKGGYTTEVVHLYNKTEPPSENLFAELFSKYQEKLSVWEKESQGRPDQKKRPRAPYDFSKMTISERPFRRRAL